MDKIIIRDLKISAVIGTFERERRWAQPLVFNIELSCATRKAGKSDLLKDTVNYKDVKREIIRLVKLSKFHLLESAADAAAGLCLSIPGVKSVKVTVDKPGALRHARSVAVEIVRP